MTEVAPNEIPIVPPATAAAIEASKPKMVAMLLERNYRPTGEYEIVGYNQTEIKVRTPAGINQVVRPAAFIPDQQMPPAVAGVGPEAGLNKLLAGTVVRLTKDEANRLMDLKLASRTVDD